MSIVREESMAATTGGQRGFIPISINMAPPHKVKRQWELYSQGALEAGREPDPFGVAHLPAASSSRNQMQKHGNMR